MTIDASLPLVDVHLPPHSAGALVLLRWRRQAVGYAWLASDGDSISAERQRELMRAAVGERVDQLMLAEWLRIAKPTEDTRLSLTVAICARQGASALGSCVERVSQWLTAADEVLIVDYAGHSDATSDVVRQWPTVRYVREENATLVRARNRALREARRDVVVFLTEDVVPDEGFVDTVRREFADTRSLCVVGSALPVSVASHAQDWIQQSTLGRRWERVSFDGAISKPFTPPSATIRSNVALRRSVLELVGAFDEALEVREGSQAGVDHDMAARVLVAGYRVVYQPAALVRYEVPADREALLSRIRSAAAGIGAYLTSHIRKREHGALTVAAAWLWTRLRGFTAAAIGLQDRQCAGIQRAELAGFASGVVAYARTRRLTKRPEKQPTAPANELAIAPASPAESHRRPHLSVIVPTHNRRDSLLRLLTGLRDGSRRPDEIIVVADGCTDDTVTQVRQAQFPFPVTVLEQSPARGAAAARNLGAARASGDVLLFIDDDIEPLSTLVAVHAEQAQAGDRVVVGAPIPVRSTDTLHDREMWSWWEREFERLCTPGYRFTYNDVFSGVLSVPARMFRGVGGFDTAFTSCRDDSELALRLLREGACVVFSRAAGGFHHELRDAERLARRKHAEGRADALIAERHREIGPALRIAWPRRPWWTPMGALRRAAFHAPRVGRFIATFAALLMPMAEHARARRIWRVLNAARAYYWYWDGVAAFVGNEATVRALASGAATWKPNELTVDLSFGIERAAREVERVRPDSVLVTFGDHELGRIAALRGAERLRGDHLPHRLANDFGAVLLRELKTAGEIRLPWDTASMTPPPSATLRTERGARRGQKDPA